jgi:hypothetical protein
VRRDDERNEVEMLMPVVAEVFGNIGITKDDVDFICSGSTDYLIGGPFSFVMALDAVGVWPPRSESHVEMDGAWALYEAWVLLQEGEIDAALVYSFGRSSLGDLGRSWPCSSTRTTWPRCGPTRSAWPPCRPGPSSTRARPPRPTSPPSPPAAARTPWPTPRPRWPTTSRPRPAGGRLRGLAAAAPRPAADHRRRAAIVLAAGDKALEWSERPVWITGFDHRMETHSLGARDLTSSPSTAKAAEVAGVADGPVDVAEIHAPFAHQEIIVAEALGLDDGGPSTRRAARWPPTR